MILTIVGFLLVLWVLAQVIDVGGSLIHLLVVIAVVVFLWNLITGRRKI
jgi:Family of unknown function (DUF5670)